MNLSMWIIQKWLEDYSPTSIITGGRRTIEGVRVFGANTVPDKRYVYIGRNNDMFVHSDSEEVLLIHCNDMISFQSEDLGEILNETLEAFEFYNKWELALHNATKSDTPEQDIIDACEGIFGPMFLLDLNLNLIAYTKSFEVGEVNSSWDDFIQINKPSLKTIKSMKESRFFKLLPQKHDCLIYTEPKAAPYSHGIMLSYCTDGGELLAQMSISSTHPAAECDIQLARFIGDILGLVENKSVGGSSNSFAEGIFYNIVAGEDVDEFEIEKLLLLQGWPSKDSFVIVRGETSSARTISMETYKTQIKAVTKDSITVVLQDRVYSLIRLDTYRGIETSLFDLASSMEIRFGISNPFSSLGSSRAFVHQADEAVAECRMAGKKAYRFHSCALRSILATQDDNFRSLSLHPAVLKLAAYDAEHGSSYGSTLKAFLRNERSYLHTSAALHVHRNTIPYRLGRIQEIAPIDLDDPYEREYALASFRFLEQRPGFEADMHPLFGASGQSTA